MSQSKVVLGVEPADSLFAREPEGGLLESSDNS